MRVSTYKQYLLILLMIIFAFNNLDRLALGIVLQDLKLHFNLSDTQLGLLSGISFTFFYALMGIPIARWADRGDRVVIITLTTGLWSGAVALCGAAGSFIQLLLIRVFVAVGEAGCIPPAHSLIADNFSRAERPRAMAKYLLGAPLALATGYFAAGWLNELYGWRATFVVLGVPGFVLAALAFFTVEEPRRMSSGREVPARFEHPSLVEVLTTLWSSAAYRHLLICFSVWFFFAYGILQWQPAFFIRSHGLPSGALGTWFAAVYGIGGALGIYLGGHLAARYAAGNERIQLVICAFAFSFFAILTAGAFMARNHYIAFAALAVGAFGGNMAQGPMLATIQTLVAPRMRAISVAVVYMFANLIGMGLGPLAAGALSDGLRPWFGDESLRYAMVILCPGYFWAAWHLWRASKTVARDLQLAQVPDASREIISSQIMATK